jgi:hypothetical protein
MPKKRTSGWPRHRKFGGDVFTFDSQYSDKTTAKGRAGTLRNRDGAMARVVKAKTVMGSTRYLVYFRPKSRRKSTSTRTGKMYKIVRFRFKGQKRVIKRGLTLAEARAHCNNPKTRKEGVWFDGYTEDK